MNYRVLAPDPELIGSHTYEGGELFRAEGLRGIILLTRRAGSQAAVSVMETTAAVASEMEAGSSGVNF